MLLSVRICRYSSLIMPISETKHEMPCFLARMAAPVPLSFAPNMEISYRTFLSEFEGKNSDHRKDDPDDHESLHNLRLWISEHLVMMVQG